MKVETIGTVNNGGEYFPPGSLIELPDDEARELLSLGVVKYLSIDKPVGIDLAVADKLKSRISAAKKAAVDAGNDIAVVNTVFTAFYLLLEQDPDKTDDDLWILSGAPEVDAVNRVAEQKVVDAKSRTALWNFYDSAIEPEGSE